MRNKDVIYVSNAIAVETTKFLNYLRTIMATANDPIIYATNAYALKAASRGGGIDYHHDTDAYRPIALSIRSVDNRSCCNETQDYAL